MSNTNILRKTAEELYQKELDALKAAETDPIPTGWRMSPRSVLTYIMGNTKVGGVEITPKYMGNRRLVEIAIATLVTDRALLLIGEPGTAKSWLSEHLAAAINGDSTKVVQGTAGTTEEQIRYSWNYAMLIAKGPSQEAMVKSPVYRAMETGSIARIEEISRCASEVQDALISILSEKRMSVPELGFEVPAQKGFSVIATANTRDKGVNDMSAALKRRFNIVVLPTPADMATEIDIVRTRVEQMSSGLDLNAKQPDTDTVEKIVTIFRELRSGATLDGKQKLKTTSGVLSTAEAISLLANSMALAGSFGNGRIQDHDLAAALQGAIVKDEDKDSLWYELQGDYYIPCLVLDEEDTQPIGIWGRKRLDCLKKHRRALYTTLLVSGKLNSHLVEVDSQASEMFYLLMKQLAEKEGITEQLKAQDQMAWVGAMNNIRNQAEEIVVQELIFA